MATVFWDRNGVLLIDFLPAKTNVLGNTEEFQNGKSEMGKRDVE